MDRTDHKSIFQAVEGIWPPKWIEEEASRLGFVKRRRKLNLLLFVRCLVLGMGSAGGRSLCGLRRTYIKAGGGYLARSSFHQRFTEELVSLLSALVDRALRQREAHRKLGGAFSALRELFAIDSSIVQLAPKLADDWPGAWAHHSPAAMKITTVTNVVGRNIKRLRLPPGSRHDVHLLEAGPWLKDRLLIMDLGFLSTPLFKKVADEQGYFRCRLRKRSTPKLLKVFSPQGADLVGLPLRDAQNKTSHVIIDALALMTWQERPKKSKCCSTPFRVIAIRSNDGSGWFRYVTNAPPEMLSADACSAIYAARWEVELMFKEMKSEYRLDEFSSKSAEVHLALIHASLLSFILSKRLRRVVMRLERKRVLPHDRWARVLRDSADRPLEVPVSVKIVAA